MLPLKKYLPKPNLASAGYYLIFATVIGITSFYREFTKIHLGPLYILEVVFLLFFLFELYNSREKIRPSLNKDLKTLLPFSIFFIWGLFLFILDIVLKPTLINTSESLERFFQHGILFVYPILWTWVGYRLAIKNTKFIGVFGFLTLFFYSFSDNRSTGPLLAVAFIYFLAQSLKSISNKKALLKNILSTFVCGIAGFISTWILATSYMNRTSLVLILSSIVIGSFLFSEKKLKSALLTASLGLVFFFGGMELTVQINTWKLNRSPTISQSKPTTFVDSLSHGDDRTDEKPGLGNFQFRFRRFQWETALNDWKTRPWLGIGFIPEVPSWHQPGIPNNGKFFSDRGVPFAESLSLGFKPASGPHNSYLSILVRMGPIGITILLWILFWSASLVLPDLRKKRLDLESALLIFIPLNGFLFAIANVGFESPHNCFLLWLFLGLLKGRKLTFVKHA